MAACRPRDPRDARRERRAEHDRLRLRRRPVWARLLRSIHPAAVLDGLRLPGDVHAHWCRHPPRLRRAGAAATRQGLGLVRRRRPHAHQPRHARRGVRLDSCRTRLLPPLLALGAHRPRHGALQRPLPARRDPRQARRRRACPVLVLQPLPRRQLQHAAAAAGLDDRRHGDALDDLLPAERVG